MKDGTLQRAGALLLIFTILCGLAYMLAMTGIVIWWRKRRSRQLQAQRTPARQLSIQ